jgi:sugar phosphate isomerase/epimerase
MNQPADRRLPRREVFRRGGYCVGAALAAPGLAAAVAAAPAAAAEPFRYCLNTATLLGHKLSLTEEVEIAAAAGYQAIEFWLPRVQDFARQGGSLADLKKRIADRGLSLESTIAFDEWISEAAERSPQKIEAWKRDLDLVAQLGGRRICASPLGASKPADCDLPKIAARYGRLLKLGRTFGVTPQLELWGRAPVLRRLGEVAYVLVEAGDPSACAVLDVIHIYTGGSPLAGLRAFNGSSLHVFHLNDYPAQPGRDRVTDAMRVYPGDGVAPLDEILRNLRAIGFRGFLSLELFNEIYWRQPAGTVARVGLEKMRAAVARALKG